MPCRPWLHLGLRFFTTSFFGSREHNFIFGHLSFGRYTGDPGGEGERVESLKDEAREGKTAGHAPAQSKVGLGGADVDRVDVNSSNTLYNSPK